MFRYYKESCYTNCKKTSNFLVFRDTYIKSIKTGMTIINIQFKTMFLSLEKRENVSREGF